MDVDSRAAEYTLVLPVVYICPPSISKDITKHKINMCHYLLKDVNSCFEKQMMLKNDSRISRSSSFSILKYFCNYQSNLIATPCHTILEQLIPTYGKSIVI